MGFSSGSFIFEDVAKAILGDNLTNVVLYTPNDVLALASLTDAQKRALLKALIQALFNHDWDDAFDQNYADHPIFLLALREVDSSWLEDEDEEHQDDE